MDCQHLIFSPKHSQNRIEKALQILPELVVKKILFFALYLLGARLNTIASLVELPINSGKTTVNRVLKDGILAFRDRRQLPEKSGVLVPVTPPLEPGISVKSEGDYCIITFADSTKQLKILQSHRVHLRSVLLSLCQANLISNHTASAALGITVAHCSDLWVQSNSLDYSLLC